MSRTLTAAISAVTLLLASVGTPAAEERTPNPEEFRQIIRQYNESGSLRAPQRPPQAPKGAAEFNRAVALQTKRGATPAELKEAAALYQTAFDAGIAPAGTNLALLYLEGMGVKKDVKKALALLQSASKKNDSQADVVLARLYLLGKDVPRDEKKAETLLNKAVKAGNRNAATMLAEYREWKKKNEQSMKEYQDILKQMQAAQARPGTVQPLQMFPPPSPSRAGIPFPVIPGYGYVAGNPVPMPNFMAPAPPTRPQPLNIFPTGNAVGPNPVSILPQGNSPSPLKVEMTPLPAGETIKPPPTPALQEQKLQPQAQ